MRQATDVQGAVTAAREWTPYGVEVGGAQAGPGYTGEWFDAPVGLQYLRARWLDVSTGRFTSEDPWEGELLRPQSLSRWAYVEANPLRFVDPLGFRGIIPWDLYYSSWGKSFLEGDPDIKQDLGSSDDTIAAGAIRKIELNFEGRPGGPSATILYLLGRLRPCLTDPYRAYFDYPGDMISYELTEYEINYGIDYDRYDWLISGWVDYWNWHARLEGETIRLDPNFVKAITYVETRAGYVGGNPSYYGVMQLGEDAISALKGGTGGVTWGSINVVDERNTSHNIGGGVRWLMYKYEADIFANRRSWEEAYSYYAGFGGDLTGRKMREVMALYRTGLDPDTYPPGDDDDLYLFRRSILFPPPSGLLP